MIVDPLDVNHCLPQAIVEVMSCLDTNVFVDAFARVEGKNKIKSRVNVSLLQY